MLYANETGALVPGALPIVRCAVPPSVEAPYKRHFLDAGEGCAGSSTGVAEETVGYAAGQRSGGWASALSRCFHAAAAEPASPPFWYHTVHAGPVGLCAPGDVLEAALGFVV